MTKVLREPYWNKLVSYYYDNIHWDTDPTISMYDWIDRDFKGNTTLGSKYIYFDDEARANWFVMRWQS